MEKHSPQPGRYASIDIGTNSVLLLIAQWDGERLHPVEEGFRVTRLGQQFKHTGQISPEAIVRTAAVLEEYRKRVDAAGVKQLWCTGTQIFRAASNGKAVADQLARVIGVPVTILPETTEAALTFLGALDSVADKQATYWAIDIGGGSTEIALGSIAQLQVTRSFPVGGVTLLESHMPGDQLTPAAIQAIQQTITAYWQQLPRAHHPVIGIGGTPTTLAALQLRLRQYDGTKIDGYRLTRHQLQDLFNRLNAMSLREREQLPGMEKGRADVILPATVVLQSFLEFMESPELIVSARGLRYGVILWHLGIARWPISFELNE